MVGRLRKRKNRKTLLTYYCIKCCIENFSFTRSFLFLYLDFFYGLLLRKYNSFPVFLTWSCALCLQEVPMFLTCDIFIFTSCSVAWLNTWQNRTYVKFAMYQNEGLFQINHAQCTTFWSRCLNFFQMQKLDVADFFNNGNVSMKSELNETKLCNINQVQTYLNWREREKKNNTKLFLKDRVVGEKKNKEEEKSIIISLASQMSIGKWEGIFLMW